MKEGMEGRKEWKEGRKEGIESFHLGWVESSIAGRDEQDLMVIKEFSHSIEFNS